MEKDIISIENFESRLSKICRSKGHTIGEWIKEGNLYIAECLHCKHQVLFNPHPANGEVDVIGSPIGIKCEDMPLFDEVVADLKRLKLKNID